MTDLPLISEQELVAAHQRGEARAELRHVASEIAALNDYCRRVISGEQRTAPREALVHIQDATAGLLNLTGLPGRASQQQDQEETHVAGNDGPGRA